MRDAACGLPSNDATSAEAAAAAACWLPLSNAASVARAAAAAMAIVGDMGLVGNVVLA